MHVTTVVNSAKHLKDLIAWRWILLASTGRPTGIDWRDRRWIENVYIRQKM